MNKPATVELPEHLLTFVESQVAAGHYGSLSEAVQAALRLLEEQEARLEHLREALAEGEDSPVIENFDRESFLRRMRAEHAGE